jgi:hypothetical protein
MYAKNNPPAYLCHQKTHVNVPIKIYVHTVEGYKLSVRKGGAYMSSAIPKALRSMAMQAPAMAALHHKPYISRKSKVTQLWHQVPDTPFLLCVDNN